MMITAPAGLSGEELPDVGLLAAALAREVAAARGRGQLPLIIGGDCTVALGVVAGLGDEVQGIVWVDAHGDFNTPATSPSGYLGGMPLATVTGRGLPQLREAAGQARPFPEEQVLLLGVRDLDPEEQAALDDSPVTVLTTDDLRDDGSALAAALDRLGSGPLYLHVDVDVLDPSVMPGVVYPVAGGLSLAEIERLLHAVTDRCTLAAVSLTAVNLAPLDAEEQQRALQAAVRVLAAPSV